MSSTLHLSSLFLPDQLLIPVAILLGVMGLFLRLIGLRCFGGPMIYSAIGLVILPALLGPLMEEILTQVPIWVVVVFLVALGFNFVRLVLAIFLGKEGAGTLMAMAVAGALKTMSGFPGLIIRWMHGLQGLLHSPYPGKRVIGIALAILLAVLAGLTGRQLENNDLLPWNSSSGSSGAQTVSLTRSLKEESLQSNHW